jgi:hypothetical protein
MADISTFVHRQTSPTRATEKNPRDAKGKEIFANSHSPSIVFSAPKSAKQYHRNTKKAAVRIRISFYKGCLIREAPARKKSL